MNSVHIHLILNHLPVIILLLGLPLMQWALWHGDAKLVRLSLALFIFGALCAVLVYWSGEESQELARRLHLDLPEAFIERHARWALASLSGMAALGLVSVWGILDLRGRQEAVPSRVTALIFLLAFFCAGVAARTSWLGGQIHHSEIQGGFFHE